ncbi:hypothetical protein O181_004850 [Austropuccinia psidii MF-1]|uniref:Uncharacterized protein n=1 Tax=Austropuccinia psidii MF-1 TaxID=1389203 RepID=A0A9Q3BHU8_9BASI|nr:hypothetical protein [Austropuccinia psidii MF-1]
MNVINQEIAPRAQLKISPYKSKTTDNSLNPIGQIKDLDFTFGNEEKKYMDFLVFEIFNQIVVKENPRISSSSKEGIFPATYRKSQGKESEEDEQEVEDSEAIEKIKKEPKKMRRNLYVAIGDPEKWLAHKLSEISEMEEEGSPQKKLKMDLKPPEVDFSVILEDYFSNFLEEIGNINDIEKYLINEELNYEKIKPLEKRKFKELENKSAIITQKKMDQVWDRNINKRIEQRMEKVPEGKMVQSEDDFV